MKQSKILDTMISRGVRRVMDVPKDGTLIYASFGPQDRLCYVIWDDAYKLWLTGTGINWHESWMNYWYEIP